MEAIKKKMQNMKLEKDNAMDRADACEQQAKDANIRAEKAQEEVRLLISRTVWINDNEYHKLLLLIVNSFYRSWRHYHKCNILNASVNINIIEHTYAWIFLA